MKIFSASLLAVLCTPALVRANCTDDDQSCDDYSGSCSLSTAKYFAGFGSDTAAKRADLFNEFSYGRFCGASSKCTAANIAEGGGPEPPTPCNAIDTACKEHDKCLNELKDTNGVEFSSGKQPNIDFPERCGCDIAIVADLALAFVPPLFGTGDLQGNRLELCDKMYYDDFGDIPEAFLVAAPFCQLIFEPTNGCIAAAVAAGVSDFCSLIPN